MQNAARWSAWSWTRAIRQRLLALAMALAALACLAFALNLWRLLPFCRASCLPALASCLAAAFGGVSGPAQRAPWNFTTEELVAPSRERWMRRQATYLLMRHLLLTNADALADILERVAHGHVPQRR